MKKTYVEADKGAGAEQEHAEVARAGGQGGDHDDDPDDAGHRGGDDVPAVLTGFAGRPGDADRGDVGEDVGRGLDEVGHEIRVA